MSIEVTLKPRTARSKLSRRDPAPKSSALPPAGNVAITFEKVDHRYSMPRVLHPSILETSSTRSNVLVSVIGTSYSHNNTRFMTSFSSIPHDPRIFLQDPITSLSNGFYYLAKSVMHRR